MLRHSLYSSPVTASLPTPQSVLHDADDLHQTPPTQQPSHYVYKDTSTTQYNRVHTVLIRWGWGMVWVNPLEIWIADHPEEARESDLSVSIDTCVAPSSYWTKLWKMVQNGVFSENKQLLAFYAMIVFKLAIPFWAVIYYSYEKKKHHLLTNWTASEKPKLQKYYIWLHVQTIKWINKVPTLLFRPLCPKIITPTDPHNIITRLETELLGQAND